MYIFTILCTYKCKQWRKIMIYTLPSGLASITDNVSGGASLEITTPGKAKDRNKALLEALEQLLIMTKEKKENEYI